MQYWLEHHARFTRHAVKCCYSSCNYATLFLVTVHLSCSSTFSLLKSGILYQLNSKFLPIGSKTLCRFFAAFELNSSFERKRRLDRLCVGLAVMQMFDMLEKKRAALYLYLLMIMICNVVLTVSSTDTIDNNSMCIGEKGEKVSKYHFV